MGGSGGNTWGFVKLAQQRTTSYDGPTVFSQQDNTYDNANGNLTQTVESGTAAGNVVHLFEYYNYGDWNWRQTSDTIRQDSATGPIARQTLYRYETGTGNLLEKEAVNDSGNNPIWRYGYYSNGNLKEEHDPNGNPPTRYEYDLSTNTYPVKITNEAGHETTKAWDYRYGKERWVTDPNAQTTTYDYDPFGRLTTTDFPDGGRTEKVFYDYCQDGDCTDARFPLEVQTRVKESTGSFIDTRVYYDGLGRKVQAVEKGEDNNYVVAKTHYDTMGRKVFEAGPFFQPADTFVNWPFDENGYTSGIGAHNFVHTQYDGRGRPVFVRSPVNDGSDIALTSYTYSGFSTAVIDPDACTKTETKDYLGRIIEVVEDPGGLDVHTHYVYNAAGDLLEVRNALWQQSDPAANRIKMTYSTLGRKIDMDDPDMGHWTYGYDPNGNLTLQTDAGGKQIAFDYDALNRVEHKTYPAPIAGIDKNATFAYDQAILGVGRPYSTTNGDVTTVINAYDPMGRTLETTKAITGTATRAMAWEYDPAGRVARLTYPHTGATPSFYVDYDFHPGSQLLHTAIGSDGMVFATLTGYEPTGKMGTVTFGNQVTTDYGYDDWSQRLTSILTQKQDGTRHQDRAYGYSKAGDIDSIDDAAWNTGETYYYSYDKLHRLLSETASTGSIGITPMLLQMAYDNPAHIHAVSSVTSRGATKPYTYDVNGNLTAGPDMTDPFNVADRSLMFNTDNMPYQVGHSGGGTIQVVYDSEQKRAKKSWPNGSTYYFSNEFELVGATGTETCYVFAGNLRVAMVKDYTDVTYFHKDHLGSSTVMTAANGDRLEQTRYMPFGGKRGENVGISLTDYKFTDQEHDKESRLYNYDARLYDPIVGRFVSADSVVPSDYDVESYNCYSYCVNNPLAFIDPTGHYNDPNDFDHGYGDDFDKRCSSNETMKHENETVTTTSIIKMDENTIYVTTVDSYGKEKNMVHKNGDKTPFEEVNDKNKKGRQPFSDEDKPKVLKACTCTMAAMFGGAILANVVADVYGIVQINGVVGAAASPQAQNGIAQIMEGISPGYPIGGLVAKTVGLGNTIFDWCYNE